MQKGLKKGHVPASDFSRPEFRSCVYRAGNAGYDELVTDTIQKMHQARSTTMGNSNLNFDRVVFGSCYCYPRALQHPHQDSQDLDLSSAGNWKVLKALAKAKLSGLPDVDLSFN